MNSIIHHEIRIPIWNAWVDVLVYNEYGQVVEWFKPDQCPFEENCCQMAVALHNNHFVIVLDNDGECKLSQLVHEIIHLKNYIFHQRDFRLDIHNDEAEAYTAGYLFEEIFKIVDPIVKWKTK